MSYKHQVNDIQLSGTIEGVRLQDIHGTYSNKPKSQEVSQNSSWGWGYSMMPHDMAEMSYGTAPTPTGFRYEPSEAYHPHPDTPSLLFAHPPFNKYGARQCSPASSPADSMGSPNSPLRVSDEEFAPIEVHIKAFAAGIVCQRAADLISRKRCLPPDEDMGANPCGWGFESGHPGVVNQGDVKNMNKRRRTTDDKDAGVGPVAQWDESRELPLRRTPARIEKKSKLEQRDLNMETPVAPLQGVPPPHIPGPSIIGATLESYEYASQAWNEGSEGGSRSGETVGIDDAHDEDETDGERWKRLMCYENGGWVCVGCGGKPFSDRCTLQRHCKSAVHAKDRDFRKCPFCPKEYLRSSNVNRHTKNKHPEEWERMVRLRG